MEPLAHRGVWAGTRSAGTTRESVAQFATRLAAAGVNELFLGIKEGDGSLCWPSKRFPQAVPPPYRSFDLPAVLLEECGARGISVHAWLIDYFEGEEGAAFREHPEWAMRDAKGRTTADEWLRGRRFGAVWMCPARRPGYTDQWLVPIYEELAESYGFASIHHDYIRYPGDLAPDQYCFCDYCLKDMPRFNGFVNECRLDEPFYHESYDRPYLEAHWEPSPRVLPPNWDALGREFKSRFLLEGSFFQTGRLDLDYFFYTYRTHWINEFARLSHEAVKKANPRVDVSGAVFKNPIHSGRFIGQDWRQFARHMEIAVPMDYRDHFPGTFEDYLDLLGETIGRQRVWARECRDLWIGIAINFLYKEESDGPYPPAKLHRTLERIASSGANGAVLFSDGHLTSHGLWQTAAEAFLR